MNPRLKDQYEKIIVPNIQKKFSLKNKLTVPKLIKVVLNMGLGVDGSNKTILKNCIEDMSLISGQRPVTTIFRKSISNFKTRQGTPAGIKVTLRSSKMYEFVDRLVNIALPRIKDFQGLSQRGFDKSGGYSFGIKEHVIFPEVNFDKVEKVRGMDITVVTSTNDKLKAKALLDKFNFPFIKKGAN